MQLFSEKVNHTSTNSSHNILQVESFNEIFFNIFEVEINKTKYPVEKVADYKGNPVVFVPVLVEGTEIFHPFILTKGKFEVLFNENNTETPIDEYVPELIFESLEEQEAYISTESKEEILKQIEDAKKQAKQYAINVKKQKINEANDEILKNKKVLKKTLDNARDSLVNEFINISGKIKTELFDVASIQYDELKDTLDNKIQSISEDLKRSLSEDFTKSSELFDTNIKKLVKEMYISIVLPKVEKELVTIATGIVEKVDNIEKTLDDKLKSKVDISIVEGVNKELSAINDANIELNNSINKGINKALSRVGNVKLVVDKLEETLNAEVDKKITEAVDNISNYYSEKIQLLEDKTFNVTEESRKYFIGLINESKDNLLSEIKKIKTEKPVEYIIESGKKSPEKVDLASLKKEYDKIIADKFSNEVVNLRKYISVYASGGGTNATQYQDGGVMNGALQINNNLTVLGAISASQYLGIPTGGTADALPLSGGTLTGGLTGTTATFNTISAGQYLGIPSISDMDNYLPLSGGEISGDLTISGVLNALSANIQVLDIQIFELSGFEVTGDVKIDGATTILGALSASSYLNLPPLNYLPLSGGSLTGLLSSNNGAIFSGDIKTSGTTSTSILSVYGSQAYMPVGSVIYTGAPGITFNGISNTGLAANNTGPGSGNLAFWESGVIALNLTTLLKEFRIPSDFKYAWSSATHNNLASDTILYRSSAGALKTDGSFSALGSLSSNSIIYANTSNSDNWGNVYTAYKSTSAANASVNSTVINLSSGWQTAYTSLSGKANLSGGNIFTGNQTVVGDISATGKASFTSVNDLTLSPASSGFTIAGGTTSKTLTVSNSLTLSGTDSATLNIGSGGALGTAAFTSASNYAILAGVSGGQSLNGGTDANDDLTLQGTSNSTRTTSYVNLQPNGGSVGIGTSSPDSTAALDIISTTKGTLLPRLTTTQRDAIPSPANGLVAYNTTQSNLNTYNSTISAWETVVDSDFVQNVSTLTQAQYDAITPVATTLYIITDANTMGGISTQIVNTTTNYTLTTSDATVNVTANSVTIQLPSATGIMGRHYVIKNSGTGVVTVSSAAANEYIDGSLTYSINDRYQSIEVQSTGTNWIII